MDNNLSDPKASKPSRASAADVAREAGVSVSAVSRAFTPGASISARMRNRVMAAAEKLEYVPNALARSLMTQRTHLIGVIMANFSNPWYLDVLNHFTRVLQNRGLRMILLNVSIEDDLEANARMILQYGIDGLVVSAGVISPLILEQCRRRHIPLVAFARRPRRGLLHVVCADNVAAGRLAARRMIEVGHRSFGYIGGPATASTSAERLKGFRAEIEEAGFALDAVELSETYTYSGGKAAAHRLLARSNALGAVFCASDMMAIGTLDYARHELGLSVPGDLSVVGFDDINVAATDAYALSTIRQPVEEMVIATVDLLSARIQTWSEDCETRLFACSYVARSTLGSGPAVGEGELQD